MYFFQRTRQHRIPPNATLSITQEGRARLQEFSGDPKSQILMALETRGSSSVAELSQASGLSRGQVERYVLALLQQGRIQYVSAQYESIE